MKIGTEDIHQHPERMLGVSGLAIWDAVMVRVVRAIKSGIIITNTSNLEIKPFPAYVWLPECQSLLCLQHSAHSEATIVPE